MHACMHVCMHVCMYVCVYVCTYRIVCIVCMHVTCVYIYSMYISMYRLCLYICTCTGKWVLQCEKNNCAKNLFSLDIMTLITHTTHKHSYIHTYPRVLPSRILCVDAKKKCCLDPNAVGLATYYHIPSILISPQSYSPAKLAIVDTFWTIWTLHLMHATQTQWNLR